MGINTVGTDQPMLESSHRDHHHLVTRKGRGAWQSVTARYGVNNSGIAGDVRARDTTWSWGSIEACFLPGIHPGCKASVAGLPPGGALFRQKNSLVNYICLILLADATNIVATEPSHTTAIIVAKPQVDTLSRCHLVTL